MKKFFLDRHDAALVLIDLQERLAAVMSERERVVANCLHLIAIAGMYSIPVIVTEQYPKGLGPTVTEIRDALQGCRPVEKITFSCCEVPSFLAEIRATGRTQLVLAGMETHICVLQTCLGLLSEGFTVHVAADAVCSRTKANWKSGCGLMRDAGAVLTNTETVLFQLLKEAGTEEFKAISKRIR